MRDLNKFVCLIILSMILLLGSCAGTKSYAAEISDINGTWLTEDDYKFIMERPEEEIERIIKQSEFSWGKGKTVWEATLEIDTTATPPSFFISGPGIFDIDTIEKTGKDSIKIIVYPDNPDFRVYLEVIFHFVDKNTIWMETKDFRGSDFEREVIWLRLSGPEK